MKKICSKCGLSKPLGEFNKSNIFKDGHRSKCKACRKIYREENKEKIAKRKKEYREENKEKVVAREKKRYENNKEIILERAKNYRKNNKENIEIWRENNKEKLKEYDKKYRKNNKRAAYYTNRRKTDLNYKIGCNLRTRINHALRAKEKNRKKYYSTIALIGMEIQDFILYLESLFLPGMTRDNYGNWHIDHILPCASFDLTDPEQQKICFNYKNLQPLWAIDNIKKGSKLECA